MTVPLNAVSSLSQSQAQDPRSDGVLDRFDRARGGARERAFHASLQISQRNVGSRSEDDRLRRWFYARRRGLSYDRAGDRYIDLLSGYGVFAVGRNHPRIRDAPDRSAERELANLAQFDVSVLAGVLAERLLEYTPWLDKAFFRQFGRRGGRSRDQIRAPRDRPIDNRPLLALLPRSQLWRAFAQRRRDLQEGIRTSPLRRARSALR